MTELARPVRADRIVDTGQTFTVEADAAECAAIAERLLLPAVAQLRCRWDLRTGQKGSVEANGLLEAEVTQECVVTTEPFTARVAEAFSVRFVIAGRESDDADDPDEPDELTYDGATLDLGEASIEQLALALDPYPRKPGAVLPDELAEAPTGAFAALAKLRGPG